MRLLLDRLEIALGIHAVVNLVSRRWIKGWVVWLQVDRHLLGSVRDKSICATIAAQLVAEHLQCQ